jgi:hypothetical protein
MVTRPYINEVVVALPWHAQSCDEHLVQVLGGAGCLLSCCLVVQVKCEGSEQLIRLKRIYNFLCSMLVLHHLLYVLFTLRGFFMQFSELTY